MRELADMDDAGYPKIWRAWFLALCALTAALLLAQLIYSVAVEGSVPISFALTRTPFVWRVVATPPKSSMHAGDLLDLRTLSPSNRWCWYSDCFWRGQSITLSVRRHSRSQRVTVVPGPSRYRGVLYTSPASWTFWASAGGAFWMIAFAIVIACRRPGRREARVLALFLVLIPLSAALGLLLGPSPITAFLDAAAGMCIALAIALLAKYAMLFQPASRARTLLSWATYVFSALYFVQWCFWILAVWTAAIDPNGALFGTPSQVAEYILPFFFSLICGALAIAETRGAERARLSWTMASLGWYYLFEVLVGLIGIVAPAHSNVFLMILDTSLFITPLGLTYALLNRKLLDVGFALNRAAVFTTVSAIVVGIFVLTEWGFDEWLRDASHAANVAVSGALALVLAFSVRFVHGRVELVVDNVFFRKRHEDEAALRAFAHEAGYINSPETLVTRTVAIIGRRTGASSVRLAIDNGDGRYGGVNDDDPAIVALRAWHKAVDLHAIETALQGELAFPMSARGRLVGALVIGSKRSGETYAPDESDAIMQVAQSVGASLAVLDRKQTDAGDSLEEIRALILEGQSRTAGEIRELGRRIDASFRNGAIKNDTPTGSQPPTI